MIGGIIKKLAGKKALIAISLFPLVKPVVRSLYNSVAGNSFREGAVPLPGSVLYCGLDIGYTEHSGIYVGGGEKCIVELSNRNGESIIKRVTPEEFTGGGLGNSIFVSCHGDASVGNAAAADAALQMVDRDLGRYNIAFNNCHMFTEYCITGEKPMLPGTLWSVEKALNRRFIQQSDERLPDMWRSTGITQ